MLLEHVSLSMLWYSDVKSSLIGSDKMSTTQEWVICCHVCCVWEIGMRIPFLKECRYVTNYLHLYVTDY